MGSPKDGRWVTPEQVDPEEDDGQLNPAGRIVHDERGNAVWKWRGETDSTGTSSGVLKYIEPTDLSVDGAESGYDPYNQGGGPGKKDRNKR